MRPKRTNYKFSMKSKKYYYEKYFNHKTLEEEDNILILLELFLVDKNIFDLVNQINSKSDQILITEKSDKSFFIFFYVYIIEIIKKYKSFYFLLFEEPCEKEKLWNDLVYKLKFEVSPVYKNLKFNFDNPYKDSNKFIF